MIYELLNSLYIEKTLVLRLLSYECFLHLAIWNNPTNMAPPPCCVGDFIAALSDVADPLADIVAP